MGKFSEVLLVCADLKRSRDFYRDVLGLKVKRDDAHRVDFDLGDGASLGLHPRSALLSVRPGSLQLGFAVQDVDEFATRCASLGVPIFQDPSDEPFGRVAVIGDPDGYPIQVSSGSKRRGR
jgi:predicted enzyme related to lactoylglutathione lyase